MYQWTSDFPFWTEVILTSAFLDFVMYDELVFRNMFFILFCSLLNHICHILSYQ